MAVAHENELCKTDGPIINIFKRLITPDTNQYTIVTNSELLEILEKEFNMDTRTLHELEVEIYLNVLKKYIKNWPGWDQFEQTFNHLISANDDAGITKMLNENKIKFKEYLRGMLDIAQPLANSKVQKIKTKENNDKEIIVMEVEATRQQLNSLFYRHPLNNSILNVTKHFSLALHNSKMLTLESIVNWWGVEIEIMVKDHKKFIIYKRQNSHKLKHTLVNKKLALETHYEPELNQQILVKLKKRFTPYLKVHVLKCFQQVLKSDTNLKWRSVLDILRNILLTDLKRLPRILNVPCDYRSYISTQRYIRFLYQDVQQSKEKDDEEKFDLYLEEIVSPMRQFHIGFCDPVADTDILFEDSIKLICTNCNLTFTGENFVWDILKHFNDVHNEEPDWKCLKCHRVFTMRSLTCVGWTHVCDVQSV